MTELNHDSVTPHRLRVLIVCGEVSGDQRAAEVVEELFRLHHDVEIRAMGGANLARLGVPLVVDSREVAGVMGFVEVLGYLPRLLTAFRRVCREIREWKPDCVVLVDYPDFNLRLAKVACRYDVPVYYYVPPKVWAWRVSRVAQLESYTSRIGVLFPFEPEFYARHGVSKVTYVGHPFVRDLGGARTSKDELFARIGLDTSRPVLLILAGSRKAELERHMEPLAHVVKDDFVQQQGFQTVWVLPSDRLAQFVRSELQTLVPAHNPIIHVGSAVELMYYADFGLCKSGTCNLEAAFCGMPLLCFYRASPLSAWIVRNWIKIKEVSLVNIVRPGTIREFLQEQCTGAAMLDYLKEVWKEPARMESLRTGLFAVREAFQSSSRDSAACIVASEILELARDKRAD
jgi:lipid-A-disaccharide synthase